MQVAAVAAVRHTLSHEVRKANGEVWFYEEMTRTPLRERIRRAMEGRSWQKGPVPFEVVAVPTRIERP